MFAFATWMERKGLGRFQNRLGPNRVGPWGLFQPVADGLKMLIKEDIVPRAADRGAHFLAPLLVVTPTVLAYAVLPMGRGMSAVDMEAGLLFFLAVGGLKEFGFLLAGWSSRNKYALLGALRALAQMISYEAPLVLAVVPVVMVAGTLSLAQIVELQGFGESGALAHWMAFTPWGAVGFVLFMIAATAESNRSPFDMPEGESEIIAGPMVEYSGFKYALFYLGEYMGLFAVSGLGATLFLGGWQAPVRFLAWFPSWGWFFLKLLFCLGLFIWLRATLPRLRVDQLMGLAWKFLLPMTLINLVGAGLWRWTEGAPAWYWEAARWAIGLGLPILGWRALSAAVFRPRRRRRVYRFAE